MKKISFLCLYCLLSAGLFAQVNVRDSATEGVLVGLGSSLQWPGGDLAETYGFNVDVSLDVWYKTKSQWLFGMGGSFMFGDNIKIADDLVAGLITDQGQIINLNGNYGDYKFFQRGWSLQGEVGRIFTSLGHNANSGLVVMLGGGYIEHKIRIENAGQDIPQLLNDYQKGYDRLSGGLMLRQFIGYMHAGSKRRINFLIGLDLVQGFTENYRGFQYDTGLSNNQTQTDLLYGVRFIWFLPIYSESSSSYYYR